MVFLNSIQNLKPTMTINIKVSILLIKKMSETEWERVRTIQNERRELEELAERRSLMTRKRKMKKRIAIEKNTSLWDFNRTYGKYIDDPPKITYGIHRCLMDNIINQADIKNVSVNSLLSTVIDALSYPARRGTARVNLAGVVDWKHDLTIATTHKVSLYYHGSRHRFIKFPVKLSKYECDFITDVVSFDGRFLKPAELFKADRVIDYEGICNLKDKNMYLTYLRQLVINYLIFILNCISADFKSHNFTDDCWTPYGKSNGSPIAHNIFFNKNEWIVKYYEFFKSRGLNDHLYTLNSNLVPLVYLPYKDMLEINTIIDKSKTFPKWDSWMRDKTFRRFASTKTEYSKKTAGYNPRALRLCYLDETDTALCRLSFAQTEDISNDIIELIINNVNLTYNTYHHHVKPRLRSGCKNSIMY